MFPIQQLAKSHDKASFDCGQSDLNRFLKQYASQLQKRNEATVYVALDENKVIGFFTLSATMIMKQDDPLQMKKYSPKQPIPAVLIGRFAVDVNYQGQGLGYDLLAFALKTIHSICNVLGIAFVVVDAKDESAVAFYERFGFVRMKTNIMRLALETKKLH